jgi:RNA polymerase sigma factor (sigma-70 family)
MIEMTKGFSPSSRTAVAALMLGAVLAMPDGSSASIKPVERAIADVQRYCSACWRNARLPIDTWNDCTQEVLCRLIQTVPVENWNRLLDADAEERREFVRAIDAVRKRSQRARKWSPLSEEVADRSARNRFEIEEMRDELHRVRDVLSPRQRRIVQMSAEGYTVKEISDLLNLPAERVSDEKYKAIHKLREAVAANRSS